MKQIRKKAELMAAKIINRPKRPPEIPWKYTPEDFTVDDGSFLQKYIKKFIKAYERHNEKMCRRYWGEIYDESKLSMKNGFISREMRTDIVEYFRTI